LDKTENFPEDLRETLNIANMLSAKQQLLCFFFADPANVWQENWSWNDDESYDQNDKYYCPTQSHKCSA